MCGIFGLVRFDGRAIDLGAVEDAVRAMRHRGPDDEGYALLDTRVGRRRALGGADTAAELGLGRLSAESGEGWDVALGFRRLSILDLSAAGHQPMTTADGRFTIVFNGEIYNYVELRAELERAGHVFRSRTDTEVLLAAYAAWGVRGLERLVGMFALGVVDLAERRLVLARDFFGIKPLYYVRTDGWLAFASEMKALLRLPGVGRTANAARVGEYLCHGMSSYGDETMVEEVRQVGGGHYLDVNLASPRAGSAVRYWRPHITAPHRDDQPMAAMAATLRERFLDSVSLHLRSDVPLGTALSGGIDSSAIVMAMRRIQGEGARLHAFSYVAQGAEQSEERWIDLVCRASGAMMHRTSPDPANLLEDLDRLIYMQDEPFGSTSIYAQYRVFRLAQEAGVKVLLDGQGADELFGGYRFLIGVRLASLIRRGRLPSAAKLLGAARRMAGAGMGTTLFYAAVAALPESVGGWLASALAGGGSPRWLNAEWFAAKGVETAGRPRSFAPAGEEGLLGQLAWNLTEVGLSELLRYEDRNSMAFSVESRVPFLTPALAETALGMPESALIASDGTTKHVLREALQGLVPEEVLGRRDKIGFITPERAWLEQLSGWVEDTLRDGAAEMPMFASEALLGEWEAIRGGRRRFDFRVWRWINLIRWARRFDIHFD